MSRRGYITHAFADGEYEFRLSLGQLIELQEKCDAGPPVILHRLHARQWEVNDVRETIRFGLIGGGMSSTQALKLVTQYVDTEPQWFEHSLVATAILAAALIGVDDEEPGKSDGEASQQTTTSPEENGDGPISTETEPS